MTGNITVKGIVLTSMPVGEYDRRLTLLTKELGKISAFVRGARRQNSTLLAVSQPFTYAEFTVFQGRSSYSITAADNVNYFAGLRADVASMYYGMYFCELADYLTRENSDETMLLKLLYQAMRALELAAMPCGLVRLAYELKALCLFGEAPQVFECAGCGREVSKNAFFSVRDDGLLCASCAKDFSGRSAAAGQQMERRFVKLSDSALYALQYIVSTPLEKLFSFRLSEEVYDEVRLAVEMYMDKHIDKPMKTLEVIRQI